MKMEDIAKIAQVSKSAVSLALSGKPGIGSETRERILRIAREMGYSAKPRSTAAPDKTSKTLVFLVITNLGIVLEEYYQQPFFRELIHFVEDRCRTKGYSVIFSSVDMEHFERDVRAAAEDYRHSPVILLGTNLSREQIAVISAKLPQLVVLDTCFDTLPVHFIEINNAMGAYQAGSHLCDIGHLDIGYVASNVRIHNFEERKAGFMGALRERGVEIAPGRMFSVAPTILSSQESMRQQLEACLHSEGKLPTALFCECDYIAISAMKTLAELGYRVPEDISVIGFDNISESVIVTPELTTIHVEKEKMAQLAVDLLTDSAEWSSDARIKTRVDTRFVERLSTSAPAVAATGTGATGTTGATGGHLYTYDSADDIQIYGI
ncbi:LacI family DNA-binding transcriptional regulator [Cohnella massiliensis]|uniref:LacI family DNA-binding transcriptional regulator n=1 Tax=Cohnella massiliensis TaxID=1816691 RepID=UPI0015936CC6|nr:LacI family DNA-binding transcriptional regulator [Cohnella massiliensis]